MLRWRAQVYLGIPGIAPDVRRRVRAADVEVIEVK
jgi:hypothetical protein